MVWFLGVNDLLCLVIFTQLFFISDVPRLQVRDVRLIMDRNSRRSKGVGYALYCKIFYFTLHMRALIWY